MQPVKIILIAFFVALVVAARAQDTTLNPLLLRGSWPSSWITCPHVPQRAYGVYHFRKVISLPQKPTRFIVHVSADNRYRLFVNGQAVCSGPARGDLYNWYFETVDLAPFLQGGQNVVAALVWNMGEYAAVAQVSNQTAFLLQGDGPVENIINTNSTWKVLQNKAYQPCSVDNAARLRTYMVIGPGDSVTAARYPWGWEQPNYADTAGWVAAQRIAQPEPSGYGSDNRWTLVPRTIPLLEETLQRIPVVRRATDGLEPATGFLSGNQPLSIPAHKTVSLLLDQSYNTLAYPELTVSGGKGATVKLTYAEALYKEGKKDKRNEVEGKTMVGNYDVFMPDGGSKRRFRPLWMRTYRYLQLDIQTGDEPLQLDELAGMYTGYPFREKAVFSSNDTSLKQIWDVGWRTARLCAGETYFDCPYYEQLQYEGDTRIQSLISLYVTGDDRLMRKAIKDFYNSRVPEGLTQGRYPSNRLQVIPPFSLYWVSMVYDHFMHRNDPRFTAEFLTAIQGVLNWYEQHIDRQKNMLGPMKWWNFVDWNRAFPGGTPDGANEGNSSVITLQYVYTLQQAASLFDYFGRKWDAQHYRALAAALTKGAYQHCFDAARGLMANTPLKNTFSQHASIIAVLAGAIPANLQKPVMQKVLSDTALSQATFYYRFYLTQALKKVGMANLYYKQLAPWRGMLEKGLTTFAENPDPTRSDCHAWSASPNYDFLATICGIMPAAPGFKKVLIKPAPGELTRVSGRMPHPAGEITLTLERRGTQGVSADIELPQGLRGEFVWNGRTVQLKGGKQHITL